MPSAAYGLRHPASTSCLGRHLRLAGRCPNNSSLFPPLAAVVVVAGHFQRKNDFYLRDGKICGSSRLAFFTEGAQRGTGGFFIHILALSVTFGDSSPKGRALGGPHRLHLFANVSPFDRLPPAGENLSRPGEVFPLRGSFLHLPVSTNKAPPFGGAGIEQSEMTERSFP